MDPREAIPKGGPERRGRGTAVNRAYGPRHSTSAFVKARRSLRNWGAKTNVALIFAS
jgi:hypothetical protein